MSFVHVVLKILTIPLFERTSILVAMLRIETICCVASVNVSGDFTWSYTLQEIGFSKHWVSWFVWFSNRLSDRPWDTACYGVYFITILSWADASVRSWKYLGFWVPVDLSLPAGDKHDMMNRRILQYFPVEQHNDVDESMILYCGRHFVKQLISLKPIRFDCKVWCLNTRLG